MPLWAWLIGSWLTLTLPYSWIARHEIGALWAPAIGLLAVLLLPLVLPFTLVVWLRQQMRSTQPRDLLLGSLGWAGRWAHAGAVRVAELIEPAQLYLRARRDA
jgi:hypothetical protein